MKRPPEGGLENEADWRLRVDRLGARADVDLNLLRHRFLELRDLDLENSVAVVRGDRVRVDRTRQRERAAEAAVRAFDAVVVAVILPLELALAADGEQAVFEADFEVALVHAGHFDTDEDLVLLLGDIDGRRPNAGFRLVFQKVETTEERLKETGLNEGVGGASNECHRSLLMIYVSCSHSHRAKP